MAALNTSRARKAAEVIAVALFVGLDTWIFITLADDFMALFMVALPYMSICFAIHEVVELWRHH